MLHYFMPVESSVKTELKLWGAVFAPVSWVPQTTARLRAVHFHFHRSCRCYGDVAVFVFCSSRQICVEMWTFLIQLWVVFHLSLRTKVLGYVSVSNICCRCVFLSNHNVGVLSVGTVVKLPSVRISRVLLCHMCLSGLELLFHVCKM